MQSNEPATKTPEEHWKAIAEVVARRRAGHGLVIPAEYFRDMQAQIPDSVAFFEQNYPSAQDKYIIICQIASKFYKMVTEKATNNYTMIAAESGEESIQQFIQSF